MFVLYVADSNSMHRMLYGPLSTAKGEPEIGHEYCWARPGNKYK